MDPQLWQFIMANQGAPWMQQFLMNIKQQQQKPPVLHNNPIQPAQKPPVLHNNPLTPNPIQPRPIQTKPIQPRTTPPQIGYQNPLTGGFVSSIKRQAPVPVPNTRIMPQQNNNFQYGGGGGSVSGSGPVSPIGRLKSGQPPGFSYKGMNNNLMNRIGL
jgi:hypothetical protein